MARRIRTKRNRSSHAFAGLRSASTTISPGPYLYAYAAKSRGARIIAAEQRGTVPDRDEYRPHASCVPAVERVQAAAIGALRVRFSCSNFSSASSKAMSSGQP